MSIPNLELLSDDALMARLEILTQAEHRALPHLLACLAEVDRRGAFKKPGFSSLFEYCITHLHYSEDSAYRRIHAARAAARFPEIYSLLSDGAVSLSTVSRLAPHLTPANAADILGRAQGKGKRAVEEMLAGMFPRPETADRIRALRIAIPLPASAQAETPHGVAGGISALSSIAPEKGRTVNHSVQEPGSDGEDPRFAGKAPLDLATHNPAAHESPAVDPTTLESTGIQPMFKSSSGPVLPGALASIQPSAFAADRFQFSFAGSRVLRGAIERARDLLWHKYPSGRLEDILLEIIGEYLQRHDPQLRLDAGRSRQSAASPAGSKAISGRTVPAWVRSKVWARDGGRCSYAAPDGRRCQARRGLELDHIQPRARGGRSDDPANIRLLCRAHNDLERRRLLGEGGGREELGSKNLSSNLTVTECRAPNN